MKAALLPPKKTQTMLRNKVNNDHRRQQEDRYGKYVIAATRLGYVIPDRHASDLNASIVWLSKQEDTNIWPAVIEEAKRLFPQTF